MKRHFSIAAVLMLGLASCAFAQDAAQSSAPANVAGKWQMTWQGFRGGQQQGTLTFQQDGSNLTGTFEGPRGSTPLTGSVDGNNISFTVQIQARRTITMAYTGSLSGDKLSGTFRMQGPPSGQGGEGDQNGDANPSGGQGGGHMRRGHRGGDEQSHTWTATRQNNSSSPSATSGDDSDDQESAL